MRIGFGRDAVVCLFIAIALLASSAATQASASGRVAVSLPVWHSSYNWGGGHGYTGWSNVSAAPDVNAYSLAANLGGQPGLWLWLTGNREYRPGYAEWLIEAPGTTRIASADLKLAYADKLFAHHCVELGLRTSSAARDSVRHCAPPAPPATQADWAVELSDPSAEPTTKQAYLRVEMPVCHNPAPTPCSKWVPELDPLKNGQMIRVKDVKLVLVDDDLPTAASSGPLRELENGYINGRESYPVTVSADDPGAGVAQLAFERVGAGDAFAHNTPCDPAHHTAELGSAICPRTDSRTWTFDTNALPEGAASFRAKSSDFAANAGAEQPWRFFVDRTAPPEPHDFDADLDEETDTANITWVAEDDPNLVDGNPGSGLAGWEHRFYHPRLGWSDWHRGIESVEVPDTYEGDAIEVQVRSLDAVDNASPTAAASLTIPATDDEEGVEENLDDDEEETLLKTAAPRARVTAAAASGSAITLTFGATSASDRRAEALATVEAVCGSKPLVKTRCYDAVRDACRVGGACRAAKEVACARARLHCPATAANTESFVKRFQPTFKFDRDDRFWPVSLSTALKMNWDGRNTCIWHGDDKLGCGSKAVLAHLKGQRSTNDLDHIDLPPQNDEDGDTYKATLKALSIEGLDLSRSSSHPQWNEVYDKSRIYWYRGGGFGRGSTVKSLQYWTYETYNYLLTSGAFGTAQGKHESDMEMVAVLLNSDNEPVWSLMSRHGLNYVSGEARRFTWDDLRLHRDGTHVVAYAARGSHAMYERCGDHPRGGGAPDDHSFCDSDDLLSFSASRGHRINLARTPWACYGGRLGNTRTSTDHRFGDSPRSPLWQQDVFGGARRPCADGDASVTKPVAARAHARVDASGSAPAAASAPDAEESVPAATAAAREDGGDPLLDAVDSCDEWRQPPTQVGIVVIACDQAQLDHFIASDLTDPGPGGAELRGPRGSSDEVPSVYAADDVGDLDRVRVVGRGSPTGLYVAQLTPDGSLVEATVPPAALPDGEPLGIRLRSDRADVVARDGHTVASGPAGVTPLGRIRTVAKPRGLRVARHGGKVIVSWRGDRLAKYVVGAGASQGSATRRTLANVKRSRNARFRLAVKPRRGERWLSVTAVRSFGKSPALAVRVPSR